MEALELLTVPIHVGLDGSSAIRMDGDSRPVMNLAFKMAIDVATLVQALADFQSKHSHSASAPEPQSSPGKGKVKQSSAAQAAADQAFSRDYVTPPAALNPKAATPALAAPQPAKILQAPAQPSAPANDNEAPTATWDTPIEELHSHAREAYTRRI